MSAFDKVIGYETIKNELLQICDMLHNRSIYENLGARLPQGLLLYGEPGLGKTLMAKSFIEESGLRAYTVRRNKGNDDFVGDITETFQQAKENKPCIVFLDDMDKFANEDSDHCDAEEYVAVQAGIDEVKNCDVFVLATANYVERLPNSLLRSGRFDRKINVKNPTDRDAEKIIAHYLSDKKTSEDVNMEDLSKMMSYSSCADLETILNEAAINAAYERKSAIDMEDLVKSVLRMVYDAPDNYTKSSSEDRRRTAIHEAGHLVVSEALCPGSVGLVSLRAKGRNAAAGFMHRCKDLPLREHYALVNLAGKAAAELYYADACAEGCTRDLYQAAKIIRNRISNNAEAGLGLVNVSLSDYDDNTSENMKSREEAVVHAELERYFLKAKDILLKNKDFLEKATEELLNKEILLYSDIKAIRDSVTITEVAV